MVLLEDLLQRERRGHDQAKATLTELAGGDVTVQRLVVIWRERAERDGTLRALAERVVRQVIAKKDTGAAIAAWEKESNGG